MLYEKIKRQKHAFRGVLRKRCSEKNAASLQENTQRRLTVKGVVNKQHIRPALVNRALEKLIKINSFYKNTTDDDWEDLDE